MEVGDRVRYTNLAGRHAGVGVITDLTGDQAKIFFDKDDPEACTKSSFYTYTNVCHIEKVEEEKDNV